MSLTLPGSTIHAFSLVAVSLGLLAHTHSAGAATAGHYKLTAVMDPAVQAPAMQVLVPEGYTFDSDVVWNTGRPACPATIGLVVRDPESGAQFHLLHSQFFCWNIPLNQRFYLGYEILPEPQNPFQLMDNYVLPRARGNQGATNLRVVGRETLSNQRDAQGGTRICVRVDIQYEAGGSRWEERVYGLFTYDPSMFCVACEGLAFFGAPAGTLDQHAPTLNTIANSAHLAPGWYSGFRVASQQLVAGFLQSVEDVGRWSRAFAARQDQLSDEQFRAWQQRNAAEDRAFENWSRAFRGVETYNDGGTHVDLDNRHDAWWTNGLGDYVGTDGITDPNDWGTRQKWMQLQKVH